MPETLEDLLQRAERFRDMAATERDVYLSATLEAIADGFERHAQLLSQRQAHGGRA